MEEQKYYFKISPENIEADLIIVDYTASTETNYEIDPCCPITAITTNVITGSTGVYTGMTYILSGGTNGESLLTCLTIHYYLLKPQLTLGTILHLMGRQYKRIP